MKLSKLKYREIFKKKRGGGGVLLIFSNQPLIFFNEVVWLKEFYKFIHYLQQISFELSKTKKLVNSKVVIDYLLSLISNFCKLILV